MSTSVPFRERSPHGRSVLLENLTPTELSEFEDIVAQAATHLGDDRFNASEVHDFEAATRTLREAWQAVTLAGSGDMPVAERLAQDCRGDLTQRLVNAEHAMRDAEVRYRDSAIRTTREALETIQHVESVEQLFHVGAEAVCRLGFDRAIVSRVEESMWTTEVIHVDGDSEWADEILAAGRSAPQPIVAGLPEQDLVRRRGPIIVHGVQEKSKIHKAVAQASRSRSYVAAPIAPGDGVIGFLHCDRFFHSGDVTQFDRDLLGLFAQGFSFAVERAVVLERFRELQHHIRTVAAGLDQAADGTSVPPLSAWLPSGVSAPMAYNTSAQAPAAAYYDTDSRLTRRELDVLSLMANGDTNGRIARRLIISEGTVKSHVKHILRKLNAANRAEAVARWHQSMHPKA